MISKENDILIAEFLHRRGMENSHLFFFYDMISGKSWHKEDDLQYGKSWDWLMPVVEQINKMLINRNGVRVIMRSNATLIEKVGKEDWEAIIIESGNGMFQNTYDAIVSLIISNRNKLIGNQLKKQ